MGFIRASYKTPVTKLILLDEIPLYDFFSFKTIFLVFFEKDDFWPTYINILKNQ